MIENHITALAIVVPAILVILYDLWTFLRKGGDSTLSWTLCLWGLRYPFVVLMLAVLGGHLFIPQCLAPGQVLHENVTHIQGTVASILGIAGLLNLLWRSWFLSNNPTVSRRHIGLLGAFVLLGVAIGHLYFPQFVMCGG